MRSESESVEVLEGVVLLVQLLFEGGVIVVPVAGLSVLPGEALREGGDAVAHDFSQ
jgi:hypothetical protein